MERAMGEAAEERTAKMLRYTEWLNLMGNLGPMLGLLGTVWGLIKTFFKIVEAGGIPNPGELAGAIGIKLVCTLLGLCIAIPALGVYGAMRNRIDTLTAEAQAVGRDMLGILRRAKKPE
jgi:biopolymer transport protein ExbB